MDIALLSDTVSLAASKTVGLAKFILRQPYILSSAILPMAALALPPVKSSPRRTASRTLIRKKRQTKRRSFSGGDDSEEDGRGDGVFGGACDDGLFGGGGYGGRRWNSDGFGGQNWDESLRWSSNDLAFNFVYEKCLEELSATELGSKVPIALMSCHLGAYFMSILMHRN